MKVKIQLETTKDIKDFVNIVENIPYKVTLLGTDNGMRVSINAKSIIGAIYTIEWSEVFCECEEDIYDDIERFVVGSSLECKNEFENSLIEIV